MNTKDFNASQFGDNLLGGLAILFTVPFSWLLRPWYAKWGASPEERVRPLPGDEIVSRPVLETTKAITIQAPPESVWPWIVQMGHGRAGLYSYEGLENLARCGMKNGDRIVPEWQDLKVGDHIPYGPEGYPNPEVLQIDPCRSLIIGGVLTPDDPESTVTTLLMALEPRGRDASRLILRERLSYKPSFANILIWRVLTEPISFWMGRKMLMGIRQHAEAYYSEQ